MTDAAASDAARARLPGELVMWVLIASELAVFGAALLLLGSVAGAQLGARLALKARPDILRLALAVIVLNESDLADLADAADVAEVAVREQETLDRPALFLCMRGEAVALGEVAAAAADVVVAGG